MRIIIVTDAWFPQTNGVVNTLAQTAAWLVRFGHEVMVVAPRDFRTVPCPSYPEIRVVVRPMPALARKFELFRATGGSYCYGGSAGIRRAALLPQARLALHDLLSHAVSAVSQVALAHTAVALVCGSAPLSRGRTPLHGEHAVGRE